MSSTATLTINGVTPADAGTYRVRLTNAMNQVFTSDVELAIQPDSVSAVVQGAGLVLAWPGTTGILETAMAPGGPWTPVRGVTSPYPVAMDETHRFYRVRYP